MGEVLLFPTHDLFMQVRRPACPECGREILPFAPVAAEALPDGRALYRHAACAAGPPCPDLPAGAREGPPAEA